MIFIDLQVLLEFFQVTLKFFLEKLQLFPTIDHITNPGSLRSQQIWQFLRVVYRSFVWYHASWKAFSFVLVVLEHTFLFTDLSVCCFSGDDFPLKTPTQSAHNIIKLIAFTFHIALYSIRTYLGLISLWAPKQISPCFMDLPPLSRSLWLLRSMKISIL